MDISWLIQSGVLLGVAALAYFVKDLKKSIIKDIDDNSKKIGGLEKEFNNYKETIAMRYVQKDEFIRAVTNMDRKLDKIYDQIAKKGE